MRFTAQYPLDEAPSAAKWCAPELISRYATRAEEVGFGAIAFTEHPAPTQSWIAGGGHAALDPFVALTLCASSTTTLELVTYLAIAPYRNPLLLAKSAASVDLLSSGRLLLGLGAGYLEGEFRALGAQPDKRGQLLLEAVKVLPTAWSGRAFSAEGLSFRAEDVVLLPSPGRQIPIWLGGNSRTVRGWVAGYADGWSPLLVDSQGASRAGTSALDGSDALGAAVREIQDLAAAKGRDPARIDVQVKAPSSRIRAGMNAERLLEEVTGLADAGATYFVVHPVASEPAEAHDLMVEFGETVIVPYRRESGS